MTNLTSFYISPTQIIIFGGQDQDNQLNIKTCVYNVETNTIELSSDLPQSSIELIKSDTVRIDNKVYFQDKYDNIVNNQPKLFIYNMD